MTNKNFICIKCDLILPSRLEIVIKNKHFKICKNCLPLFYKKYTIQEAEEMIKKLLNK